MSPVIRLPEDVFRRLQGVASPLVDTPASVIERLLDHYETSRAAAPTPSSRSAADETPIGELDFETYENRANRHVTIHKVGCSQLRKRGGVHRHGQGKYRAHATLADAENYASTTGLPLRFCKFCAPK